MLHTSQTPPSGGAGVEGPALLVFFQWEEVVRSAKGRGTVVGKAAFGTEVGLNIPGSVWVPRRGLLRLAALQRRRRNTALPCPVCVRLSCFLLCPGSSASIPNLCGQTRTVSAEAPGLGAVGKRSFRFQVEAEFRP